jgi:quinoprotein glucose dehydrogenase
MNFSLSKVLSTLLALFLLGAATFLFAMRETWEDPGGSPDIAEAREATPYPVYGGDGARQYADGALITPDNVKHLKPAWTHHTGDISTGYPEFGATSAFEATPILVEGILYYCTPFNRVVALDPATGAEIWSYNPEIDLMGNYSNQFVCRGVSFWRDAMASDEQACAARIFTATNNTRLIALDAKTGDLCTDFGEVGTIDTSKGPGKARYVGLYHHTSPPSIIGDKVVIGGSVSDGEGTKAPSGVVRAYDARTGLLLWGQDLAPPGYDYEANGVSEDGYALSTPNVWAPMITDEALGLIYAPTGNPLPDYFRADEIDRAYYGSSLVALDATTGDVTWHYQFVHKDYWDFDTPAQPTLFELERDGEKIPAVAQATKMGLIFILDRRTGEPLFPVEERPVPQNKDFPDLVLSPTQPFPVLPKTVARSEFDLKDTFGLTFWDKAKCREQVKSLKFEGMYTPVSTDWTLMYVGNAGGINWGGLSIDQERQILVVNASNFAWKARLIPRADTDKARKDYPDTGYYPQAGTPYAMQREMLMSPFGIPCSPTPWGTLTGIDLKTGEQMWQSTLGTTRDLAKGEVGIPLALKTGTPSLGGPLTTKSGLTFIGATLDHYLRAFDNATGEELWKARLPAPAVATPMSYVVTNEDGSTKQFVVVAAGGHGTGGTALSDTLVAFALSD